jgi:hypothetical protein
LALRADALAVAIAFSVKKDGRGVRLATGNESTPISSIRCHPEPGEAGSLRAAVKNSDAASDETLSSLYPEVV